MTGEANSCETTEDLQRNGYRILQRRDNFRFGIDAVLLAWFAHAEPGEKIIDLCTGTGVVMMLMEARNQCGTYTGLEIQREMAETAARSVELNGLSDHMRVVCGDVRNASQLFSASSFDVVTVNPPYVKKGGGLKNPEEGKAIARHEILLTLEETLRESSKLLKQGGRFYMVHRASRTSEIVSLMETYALKPDAIRFVHSFREKDAELLLISARRGGRNAVRIEPPLVLYGEDGGYTEETKAILYE